jgi:hypothetical protein
VSDSAGEIDLDDPEFWEKAIGLKAIAIADDDGDDDGFRGRARRVRTLPLHHVSAYVIAQ